MSIFDRNTNGSGIDVSHTLATLPVAILAAILIAGFFLAGCTAIVQSEQRETLRVLPAPFDPTEVDQLPEVIRRDAPEYPRLAKQAGLEGDVWIAALVDERGRVADAKLHESSGTASLDEAALMMAKNAEYKPALRNGRAVATWITYVVRFSLDDLSSGDW